MLSRAVEYAAQIDAEKNRQLLREVQNRIDFINLSTKTVDMMMVMDNEEVINIIYEFLKTKIVIMDLGKFSPDDSRYKRFEKTVRDVQKEIRRNKNTGDIQIVKLDEMLQEIFNKLSISNLDDLDNITDELLEALNEVKEINYENERLASLYGGNYAFVKTYQDAVENFELDKKDVERALIIVHDDIKDIIDTESILIQGRTNFIASIKSDVTKQLLKEKMYSRLKAYYDKLLGELYTNIQFFK